jgi:VWFA-related protein
MLRKLKSLPFLVAIIALQVRAQSPAPLAPKSPATSGITLKAGTRIVVVDVVVTDHNQNPVRNLKPSDFTVLEANVPQVISHFEEHDTLKAKALPPETLPTLPPGTFTNFAPAPPGDSLNILLLDTLNTPMTDQSYVRDQLKKYLKTAQPGTRTAIFSLTSHLLLLQGFTSNPETLKAIIDKKTPGVSPLLDDPTGSGGVETPSEQFSESVGDSPDFATLIANMQQFEAEQQSFELQLRAKYTLDAMNLLARYLSVFPGRKNLIWFSGSFPLSILPDGDLTDPFAVVASSEDEFRETTGLLTAAQVAVYPIDARGLFNNPSLAASNSGAKFGRNPTAYAKDQAKFFQQTASEHSTMFEMADETGGHAFVNTNGLSEAVASAIDQGSNYYTLTYTPSDPKSDVSFRKIQLKLQQQGLNLAYRRGYYAIDPDTPVLSAKISINAAALSTRGKGAPAPPPLPPDPMRIAMVHGGPAPTQILFKARILPSATASETIPAPGNTINPASKASAGPYRRYLIDLAANARAFGFIQSPDGLYQGDVETRVYVYDSDGTLIVDSITASHASLTPDNLVRLFNGGLQLHRDISVPLKGNYYIRIGLHDPNSDRLGSIEVPVATIQNLAPLIVPSAPASNPSPAPAKPK